jgi:hypothetical protein
MATTLTQQSSSLSPFKFQEVNFKDAVEEALQQVGDLEYSRVLICGDRHYKNFQAILETIQTLRELSYGLAVIEGECPYGGADLIAKHATLMLTAAGEQGYSLLPFPANFKELGPKAGPIRNSQMLSEGRPHLVLAFHDQLDNSRGTRDMVLKALKKKVPVLLLQNDDWFQLTL